MQAVQNVNVAMHARNQCTILVLAGNFDYGLLLELATCTYSSHSFLCALVHIYFFLTIHRFNNIFASRSFCHLAAVFNEYIKVRAMCTIIIVVETMFCMAQYYCDTSQFTFFCSKPFLCHIQLTSTNMFDHSHSFQISKCDIQQSISSELSGDLKAGMLAIGKHAIVHNMKIEHDCSSKSVVYRIYIYQWALVAILLFCR